MTRKELRDEELISWFESNPGAEATTDEGIELFNIGWNACKHYMEGDPID